MEIKPGRAIDTAMIVHEQCYVATWKFVQWLFVWLRETHRFDFEWDRGNQHKSAAKHGVSTQ